MISRFLLLSLVALFISTHQTFADQKCGDGGICEEMIANANGVVSVTNQQTALPVGQEQKISHTEICREWNNCCNSLSEEFYSPFSWIVWFSCITPPPIGQYPNYFLHPNYFQLMQ
ncbi:MAG: hypothetical protein J0G29_04120 [Alphaproteobacteria bacterium]|nr:hypothetical protein [Alphaproteobacteria bacterium]OJV46820.1 MAG: hypothetical protein BGO28_04255 [Alphaproteobacteria bacterium 43-37]